MRRLVFVLVLLVMAASTPTAVASSGGFDRLWGADVLTGGATGFEVCSAAASCKAGVTGTTGGAFDSPSDVAYGADGNVYVADAGNNRVQVFNATTGAFVRAFGWNVDAGHPNELGTCTVAASCQKGDFGPEGGHLYEPRGIAVGPNGHVYVTEFRDARVSEFTAVGGFVRAWGNRVDKSVANGEFGVCTVAADCDFGLNGGGSGGHGGGFSTPWDIDTDSAGNVWVSDSSSYRVQKFSSTGQFLFAIGGFVNNNINAPSHDYCSVALDCKEGAQVDRGTGFYFPFGIAVGPGDKVYVGDYLRISRFSSSGTFERTWGSGVNGGAGLEVCTDAPHCQRGGFGSNGGEFGLGNAGVAAGADSKVYLSDAQRIQRFTSDGAWEIAWGDNVDQAHPNVFGVCTVALSCASGVEGGLGGELSHNIGMDAGPGGELYVADSGNQRIVRFGPSPASAPSTPIVSSSTPASPADENHPKITGTAAAGSTVKLYASAACTGSPLATGSATEFASPGLTIDVADDSTTTVYATASNTEGTSGCSTTSVTYKETSGPPVTQIHFSAATASTPESTAGLVLTVKRTGVTTGATTVKYATTAGTAVPFTINGGDYEDASGTLSFAAGETEKTVNINIIGDGLVEGPEVFSVSLSEPSGRAEVDAPGKVTVTIVDDDVIDTEITLGPDGLTANSAPAFLYRAVPASGATFQCWVDDAAPVACNGGAFNPAVNDGPHVFHVQAISPDGEQDRSPATRSFTVDSVRPSAGIAITGTKLPNGKFAGVAQVHGEGTDPAPSSGIVDFRCAVDPVEVPQTASAMPLSCDAVPLTVTQLGEHTAYSAPIDRAGNAGIPVKQTFVVSAVPDTSITSGPSGEVWTKANAFTFSSTVPGSTFQCAVDGGAFSACSAPYVTAPLERGSHVFSVFAVSPDGAPDETPATRSFTIPTGSLAQKVECRAEPLLHWYKELTEHGTTYTGGCYYAEKPDHCTAVSNFCGPDFCPGFERCVWIPDRCPVGATCKASVDSELTEADSEVEWYDAVSVGFLSLADVFSSTRKDEDLQTRTCQSGLDGDGCDVHVDMTVLGTGQPVFASCFGSPSVVTQNDKLIGTLGPDAKRIMSCRYVLSITPSTPLQAVGRFGSGIQVAAPAAGTLSISAAGSGGKAALGARAARLSASKPAPDFKPATAKATAESAVPFTLKLSSGAKRRLKKAKKLSLSVAVKFTPTDGGKTLAKTTRITLRSAAKKPRKCSKAQYKKDATKCAPGTGR